jgi:hypothetical protein
VISPRKSSITPPKSRFGLVTPLQVRKGFVGSAEEHFWFYYFTGACLGRVDSDISSLLKSLGSVNRTGFMVDTLGWGDESDLLLAFRRGDSRLPKAIILFNAISLMSTLQDVSGWQASTK